MAAGLMSNGLPTTGSITVPPVISFIGKSNSGKTTLVENLIPQLSAQGYKVGVLKHHTHGFAFDIPGKDTWRHQKAGAQVVVLSTPSGIGVVRKTNEELPIDCLVADYYQDVDLVITEGYKRGPYPKIEVFRQANQKPAIAERDRSWIAFASDGPIDTQLPVFDLNDYPAITNFIISHFLRTPHA